MRYLKSDTLYCFSPPVMIATFVIEIVCALYVVAKYKLDAVGRLAVGVLACLAVFQLAEYNVCEGSWGVDSLTWARIGYVAITLLPPLGIHLAVKISGQKRPALLAAVYSVAVFFAVVFLFVGHGMQGEKCLGNYVIFEIAQWAVWPYALYYYGFLALGVGYAFSAAATLKKKHQVTSLKALAIGYLAFIIPTTAVNVVDPSTIAGIPSIMCGFAVILALVITLVVLPNYYHKR